MWILGVILVLALIYFVMAGLGLTKSFKSRKNVQKTLMITDFEYANDDFDWTTGGYVKLEQSTENKTHGKYSCKATFLLPEQFLYDVTPSVVSSPTPESTPSPGATPETEAPLTAPSWQPEMVLDVNSVTPLRVFEWQEYADLKMDIFNDQTQPVTYHMQVGDAHAFLYETSGPLTPKKVTNVVIPLDELIQARLDLSNIRSLRFWVDMTGATQPLVVYLDNIRLEGDATAPKAKPLPTPSPSPGH
jgi:hypothetical protein